MIFQLKRVYVVISSLLLLSSLSLNVVAGGSHGHESEHASGHETAAPSSGHHAVSKGHGAEGGHGSSGGHHDSEGSPVGKPGMMSEVTKTIHVSTVDSMRFEFSSEPTLKAGDVVKFVVTNKGNLTHEFSIGNAAEQKAHGSMMQKMPGMVHQDGNTVTVAAGETKELIWQFKGNDEVIFACNIPGHFEAGMHHQTKIM